MTSTTLSNLIMPACGGNAPARRTPSRQQDGPAIAHDQPRPTAEPQDRPAEDHPAQDRPPKPKDPRQPQTPRRVRDSRPTHPAEDKRTDARQDVRRKLRELFERLGLDTAALESIEIPTVETTEGVAELRETLARQLGFANVKTMNAAIQDAQVTPEVGENILASKQHMLDGPGGQAPKTKPSTPAISQPEPATETDVPNIGTNGLAAHQRMIDGPVGKPTAGENGLAAKPQNVDGPVEAPKVALGTNGLAADPRKLDGPGATKPAGNPAVAKADPTVTPASEKNPDVAVKTASEKNAPATLKVDVPQSTASHRTAREVVADETSPPASPTTSNRAATLQGKPQTTQQATSPSPQQNADTAKPVVAQSSTETTAASTDKPGSAPSTGQPSPQNAESTRNHRAEAVAARATEPAPAKSKAKESNGRVVQVRREYGLQPSNEQSRPPRAEPKADVAQANPPARPTETPSRATPRQDETQTTARYAPQVGAESKSVQAKASTPKAARPAAATSNNEAPAVSSAPQTSSPAPLSAAAATTAPRSTGETQVLDQVVTAIRYQATPETRSMTVRLDPPELGRVRIDIRSDAEGIRGVVQVENTRTLAELQREAPQLLDRLQEAGIRVKDLEFQMNDPGRGDQQNGQGQQAQNTYAQFSDGQGQRGQTWATEEEMGSTLGSIFDTDETTDDGATDDSYVGSDALNVMI